MTRYILTLEAQPDDIPAILRLRRLLKICLRSFGFRAVKVEELAAGDALHRQNGSATEAGSTKNPNNERTPCTHQP